MKTNKGITLIALVVTIILLIILSTVVIYSGIEVINSSKLTAFTAELKIMQTQVNELYDKNSRGEIDINTIGKDISTVQTQVDKVFTETASGITERMNYRYYDEQTIKNDLKLEGVEGKYFVNVIKRSVISYDGLKYKDETYYTLEQLPDSLYNVEYSVDTTSNRPTFDLSVERLKNGEYKVSAENINYDGNINNWNLEYKIAEEENFKESKDLSVRLYEEGTYKIKIANGNFESEEKTIYVREPRIGEYVSYYPTYADAERTISVDSTKLTYASIAGTAWQHGNGYNTQTYQTTNTLKWRILSIDNNKIELISTDTIKKNEDDNSGNFIISGTIGYLYAEQELNEICKIYGYGYGADINTITKCSIGGPLDENNTITITGSGGRSINSDDINKLAGVYEENNDQGIPKMKFANGTIINSSGNYGSTEYPNVNIYYPTIDANKGNSAGKSNLAEIKEIKNTYYYYSLDYIGDNVKRSLVKDSFYWLADRSSNTGSDYCYWGVQNVEGTAKSSRGTVAGSKGALTNQGNRTNLAIRPIVNVKSELLSMSNAEQQLGTETNPWIFK